MELRPITSRTYRNLTGIRTGRLVAMEAVGTDGNSVFWRCNCDCGKETVMRSHQFTSGRVVSCGCYMREQVSKRSTKHGMHGSREYRSWDAMKNRCTNHSHKHFSRYGGRGITFCDRWSDFKNFIADMGPMPAGNYTIDRKDNNGNYCPENCVWATRKEQARNRNCLKRFTHDGKTLTITEWSEITGIKAGTISTRIHAKKWSVEKAVTTPVGNTANKRARKHV